MNNITEWSYEKPTDPGMYLCCYGDVETHSNISLVTFREYDFEGASYIIDEEQRWPSDYSDACKWARLLVGSEVEE